MLLLLLLACEVFLPTVPTAVSFHWRRCAGGDVLVVSRCLDGALVYQ